MVPRPWPPSRDLLTRLRERLLPLHSLALTRQVSFLFAYCLLANAFSLFPACFLTASCLFLIYACFLLIPARFLSVSFLIPTSFYFLPSCLCLLTSCLRQLPSFFLPVSCLLPTNLSPAACLFLPACCLPPSFLLPASCLPTTALLACSPVWKQCPCQQQVNTGPQHTHPTLPVCTAVLLCTVHLQCTVHLRCSTLLSSAVQSTGQQRPFSPGRLVRRAAGPPVLLWTVQCSTVQCSVVQSSAVLWDSVCTW